MKNIVSARRMRELENYNFETLKKPSMEIMQQSRHPGGAIHYLPI